MDTKHNLEQISNLVEDSVANTDDLLIEHVMPFIEKLPRDKPCTAKQMFDTTVWETAPTHFGLRLAFLVKTCRLPLIDAGKLGNNSRSYWIRLR